VFSLRFSLLFFLLLVFIPNHETLSYGVDNMNLSSVDSISVIDLIVFLYSTLVQCYSFNEINNPKTTTSIMPYYLQKDLCTNEQSTWWSNCMKFIEFKNQQQSTKTIQQLTHGIEIIRLKRIQSKQLNIQICIKTALFLHNLSNFDNQRSVENCLIFSKSDLNEMVSIEEKSKYLNLYSTHYWCHILNYLRITRSLEEDLDESIKTTKHKQNLFFDIHQDLKDILNKNIYKLACLYVSNKKFDENDFNSVKDLISEIEFDKINFSDKLEYKAGIYFKKELIEKFLASNHIELIETSKVKLKEAINFIEKYEASLEPIEIKKTPIKQEYLSPIKKSPQKQVNFSQQGDSSVYKSLISNQSEDSLSMKTANETLNSTTTSISFEISKDEDESLKIKEATPPPPIPSPPPPSNNTYQQQIIDKLNETKSIKLNLYHDMIKNQFETINNQRFQVKNELDQLKVLISSLQNSYQN
jgi:hypothetical protein